MHNRRFNYHYHHLHGVVKLMLRGTIRPESKSGVKRNQFQAARKCHEPQGQKCVVWMVLLVL